MGTGQVRKDQERSRPKVRKRIEVSKTTVTFGIGRKSILFLLLFMDSTTLFDIIYESHYSIHESHGTISTSF